ncbi:MAG: VOC family protein [Polyangiales bacterium]
MTGVLSRFDHLTILVRDLPAAVSGYERLLGTPPRWRGDQPELGLASALFGVGNAIIELAAPLHDGEASAGLREHLSARGEGLHALAFGTDSASDCSSQLRSRGLRVTPPAASTASGQDGHVREYQVVELSPRASRGLPVLIVERPDAWQLMAAEPVPGVPAPVVALDHVVVRSADLDAAVALYRDGLGIRLALDKQLANTRMLFFRVGGVTLEVVSDVTSGAQDTFYGAAYRVNDLEAAQQRMQRAGLDVSDVRAGRKAGTFVFSVRQGTSGVPTLIIRDPSRD